MNVVWTLLLLAAATGAVYSHYTVSHAGYEQQIREAFQGECGKQFSALTFPNSLLPGIIPSVLNAVTSITGFSISFINVPECYISKDFNLRFVVILNGRCREIPTIDIRVDITVPIVLSLKNGCPYFSCNTLLSTCQLSIQGQSLGSTLITALLSAVKSTVTTTINAVLSAVFANLNAGLSSITRVFSVGNSPCHYYFPTMTTSEDAYTTYVYSLNVNGQEVVGNYEYPVVNPQANEYSVLTCPDYMTEQAIHLLTEGCEIQYALSAEHLQSMGLGSLASSAYFYMTMAPQPRCTTSEAGVHIAMEGHFTIKASGNLLVSGQCAISASAGISYANGNLCYNIGSLSLDGSVQLSYVPSCGCSASIIQTLLSIFNSCFPDLQTKLNGGLGLGIQLPSTAGYPGYRRSCVPQNGYIKCSEYY